jgi:AraC-like DNA-binding protein
MSAVFQLLRSPHSAQIRERGVAAECFPAHRQPEAIPHGHDVVEFFFVLRGRGLHLGGPGARPLGPGDMGVVRLGQSHCIVTPHEPMGILNLYLEPSRFRRYGLTAEAGRLLDNLSSAAAGEPAVWSPPADSPVSALLRGIEREASRREPGFAEAVELYTRLLLIECVRSLLAPAPAPALPPVNPAVERARRFIDENWREPLTLDAIAAAARVGRFHLCRLFRTELGTTPVAYIQRRRIEEAARLLTESDDKVINIAYATGFGDLAHFNRLFRRLMGMAPGDYRRRARG